MQFKEGEDLGTVRTQFSKVLRIQMGTIFRCKKTPKETISMIFK